MKLKQLKIPNRKSEALFSGEKRLENSRSNFNGLLLIILFLFFGNIKASAQDYPKIHHFWEYNTVNTNRDVEVFTMMAQCTSGGGDTLFIKIFNFKARRDTINMELNLINENNSESTSKSISLILEASEIAYSMCGSGTNRKLAIAIPSGYDAKKTKVNIKLN